MSLWWESCPAVGPAAYPHRNHHEDRPFKPFPRSWQEFGEGNNPKDTLLPEVRGMYRRYLQVWVQVGLLRFEWTSAPQCWRAGEETSDVLGGLQVLWATGLSCLYHVWGGAVHFGVGFLWSSTIWTCGMRWFGSCLVGWWLQHFNRVRMLQAMEGRPLLTEESGGRGNKSTNWKQQSTERVLKWVCVEMSPQEMHFSPLLPS